MLAVTHAWCNNKINKQLHHCSSQCLEENLLVKRWFSTTCIINTKEKGEKVFPTLNLGTVKIKQMLKLSNLL